MIKKCSKCKMILPLDLFKINASYCKACYGKYYKDYYKNNKDKLIKGFRAWYKENGAGYYTMRYRNNPVCKENSYNWRKNNPKRWKEIKQKSDKKNRVKINENRRNKYAIRNVQIEQKAIENALKYLNYYIPPEGNMYMDYNVTIINFTRDLNENKYMEYLEWMEKN